MTSALSRLFHWKQKVDLLVTLHKIACKMDHNQQEVLSACLKWYMPDLYLKMVAYDSHENVVNGLTALHGLAAKLSSTFSKQICLCCLLRTSMPCYITNHHHLSLTRMVWSHCCKTLAILKTPSHWHLYDCICRMTKLTGPSCIMHHSTSQAGAASCTLLATLHQMVNSIEADCPICPKQQLL